jgi:hypothetical protein
LLRFGGGQRLDLEKSMLRGMGEEGLCIPASCNNGDRRGVSRLVAESYTQAESEQQREYEYPENDFRLALEFEQARHQQMAVARPAAVAAGWRRQGLGRGHHCFLGSAHKTYSFAPSGLDHFPLLTHGLRRGHYSLSALRLQTRTRLCRLGRSSLPADAVP